MSVASGRPWVSLWWVVRRKGEERSSLTARYSTTLSLPRGWSQPVGRNGAGSTLVQTSEHLYNTLPLSPLSLTTCTVYPMQPMNTLFLHLFVAKDGFQQAAITEILRSTFFPSACIINILFSLNVGLPLWQFLCCSMWSLQLLQPHL